MRADHRRLPLFSRVADQAQNALSSSRENVMTSDDCRFCCTNAGPTPQGESRRVFLLGAAAAAGGLLAAPRRAAAAEPGEAVPLFAYIGCFTSERRKAHAKGISVYRIDANGSWSLVQTLETLPNPQFITFDQRQKFLYSVHGDGTEVSSYAIDKASGRTDKSKALVLWSRTLELFDHGGYVDEFLAAGMLVALVCLAALGKVTPAEADRALELVLRYDLNHLDTAASYGDSELVIAPWLKREGRDRFFLATKTGKRTYAEARDQIRESLRRLGVDHVDLIQLHNLVDQREWDVAMGKDGALRAAIEARDAGLARFIGVTGHGLEVAKRHRESLERFPFDSVLFPYNWTQLRGEEYAREVERLIALCEKRGVAMQTIKAITLGPWHGKRPATPTTWYEPLREESDIELAVRWVMSDPSVFLNTVGDVGILPLVLDAASRGGERPSDAEMDELVRRREMSPFFVS